MRNDEAISFLTPIPERTSSPNTLQMDSEIQFKRKTLWLNVLSTSQRSLPLEISAEKICWLHLKAIMQLFQFHSFELLLFLLPNRSLRGGRSCAWLKGTILDRKFGQETFDELNFRRKCSSWIVHERTWLLVLGSWAETTIACLARWRWNLFPAYWAEKR